MSLDELAKLEAEMSRICARREMRVRVAEGEIRQANKDFDRAALPLARKINALREQLEAEAKPPPPPRVKKYREPDSDWSPEDIAHYHELMQRGNG